MGDLYSELLVKKDKTAKDSLLKYGLIVLTALAVFAGLIITPLALIAAIALGIACYFVIPKTDVEYEYLFINGDFDIDMIMSKTKRKKVKSFKLSDENDIILLSPASASWDQYKQCEDRGDEFKNIVNNL